MNLNAHKLYILSGVPGSGKSTFLERNIISGKIDRSMIISSDNLREQILGKGFKLDSNNKVTRRYSENANPAVFSIIEVMLKEKLKEKLTIFLDTTAISDEERSPYISLAKKYMVDSEVLIFNEELSTCKERNSNRSVSIKEEVLDGFEARFQRDSIYPFQYVTGETDIQLIPNTIEDEMIDVVGDVHGLYSLLLVLLGKLGYVMTNGVPVHPNGRKLLFLGDFIDRGTESVEMITLVKKSVEYGHYAIIGNHELKLIKNIERGENPARGSHAVLATYSELMKSKLDPKSVASFLKSLPAYYVKDNFVFAHANICHFDFKSTPLSELAYGSYQGEEDLDQAYNIMHEEGINKHILIRGHIEQTSIQKNVYSLEEGQAFEGYLSVLQLDKFKDALESNSESPLEDAIVREKSDFNYKNYLRSFKLNHLLKKLELEKLVTSRESIDGLMRIVKYSKKVFFDNLWDIGGHPLMKARGLVLDVSGRVVQHPFDKVFNYGENNAGKDIPDNEVVQYVEKMNGFLGNITLNPFTGSLLITTTGSFDSDFVGYIKDFIDPKLEGLLKKYLNKNDVTLSFEVIHGDDPHIIHYEPNERGLKLIGVRSKGEDDLNWEESDVDAVAAEIGFDRPIHGFMEFKDVREMVRTSKLEGFMIRRKTDSGWVHALKFKSPFYSTTKFIARMNPGNIKFMYSSPNKFKEKIGEEEFFVLVDKLIEKVEKDVFLEMNMEDKTVLVREIIEELIS